MSYYNIDKNNKTLIISDDAIDVLIDALRCVSEIYQKDTDRRPILAEIEELLIYSMRFTAEEILDELKDKEVSDCKIKVSKKSKVLFQPGSVFSIFISEINKYAYGLMVKGQNYTKPFDDETYFQFFHLFTDRRISLGEFKHYYLRNKKVLFTAYCGWSGWMNGGWKKMGQLQKELFDPNLYKLPNFISNHNGVYLVSRGRADIPLIEREKISEKEAQNIQNPIGILDSEVIEKMLVEKYISLQHN